VTVFIGPATVFTLCGAFGLPSSVPPMLEGSVAGALSGNTVVSVNYNTFGLFLNTIQAGAQLLDAALRAGSGPMIVFGHSAGAVCANYWLANYVSGPIATTSISPSNLSFIFLGNSVRRYGGALGAAPGAMISNWFGSGPVVAPPSTPFTVTDCARQYDGWADWPTGGSGGGLSDARWNALAGQNSVHPNYQGVSLTDPTAVTYTPLVSGSPGNITYLWWTTTPLPILGTTTNSWVDTLDADLRPTIESGYARPVTVASPWKLSAAAHLYGRGALTATHSP
jgi:hypothetical protein